jgi:ribosomal protein S18 acetylase RimI-like enzyme
MSTDLKNLVQLKKSDIMPAAGVLALAFRNYPLLQYGFPGDLEREKMASYFFQYELAYCVRYGEVYATSLNMEGVAIWLTSDYFPMTLWKLIRSVPLSVTLNFARGGASKLKYPGDYLDVRHKYLAPFKHWYLQTIGVAPQSQGKGYAGELIRAMLGRIDKEDLPCYLETMEEKNVRLYEHFGFRVTEKSAIPKTNLNNWAMLRKTQ